MIPEICPPAEADDLVEFARELESIDVVLCSPWPGLPPRRLYLILRNCEPQGARGLLI